VRHRSAWSQIVRDWDAFGAKHCEFGKRSSSKTCRPRLQHKRRPKNSKNIKRGAEIYGTRAKKRDIAAFDAKQCEFGTRHLAQKVRNRSVSVRNGANLGCDTLPGALASEASSSARSRIRVSRRRSCPISCGNTYNL